MELTNSMLVLTNSIFESTDTILVLTYGIVVLTKCEPASRGRFLPRLLLEPAQREFFIDNLLGRIHCSIVMIRWTGLAPWEFEFPFPGCLTSTFLA